MKFLKAVPPLFLLLALPLLAQDLASFERRTEVRTLPNGLTIVFCQRHEAPVFSFYTLVDAGSVQDPKGRTGLAHMFEHMAFKGTPTIGTKNYTAEKVVLDKIEVAYQAYIPNATRSLDAILRSSPTWKSNGRTWSTRPSSMWFETSSAKSWKKTAALA